MNTRPVDEEDSLCLKNQLDQIESELKQLQEILGFWKKLNSLFMEIEKSLPKLANLGSDRSLKILEKRPDVKRFNS